MNPTTEGPWEKHRSCTASLHVPEPQADWGSRSIRNPPLMHEGMRGNNVGMFGHSGAIRSARSTRLRSVLPFILQYAPALLALFQNAQNEES